MPRDDPSHTEGTPRQIHDEADVRGIVPDGTHRAYLVAGPTRGLRLEVRAGGARTWVLEYRTRAGRHRRHSIGHWPGLSLRDARAAAREIRARVDLGEDPMAERLEARRVERERKLAGPDTVESIAARYLAEADLRPKTRESFAWVLRARILPAFGHRAAQEVTRHEIRAWSEEIARRTPYLGNRAFEVLRRVYSWAIERDILTGTPFVRLQKPGKERASERVLSTAEISALWRATSDGGVYEDAVRLLLLTGARREMVLGMRADELDLSGPAPRWTIGSDRMKSGRPHVVPLSAQAVEIIRRWLPHERGGYVFPALQQTAASPSMHLSWPAVVAIRRKVEQIRAEDAKRAGQPKPEPMPRWRLHDLRHTLATHMREDLEVSASVVSLILAHTPPGSSVSRIYDRSELLAERRAALDAWGAWVAGLA